MCCDLDALPMTTINCQTFIRLFQRQLRSSMQRSIKSFFQTVTPAKQPPGDKTEDAKDEVDSNKDEVENIKDEVENVKDDTAASNGNKRAAEDSGDDDEEVVFKRKRPTKSFLDSPPAKTPTKVAEPVERKGPTPEPVTSTTPAKQLFTQSPLLSVEALIKKKISSGSQALHENIGTTWFKALQPEFDKPYFKKLSAFIEQQRKTKTVFPPPDQVFTWTHYHPIRETRVVIIGQDPYHGPRQAHGLSFSVQRGVSIPKSLQNIYKELSNDIDDFKPPPHGNLVGWAKQGVLMLNACLTVNQGEPNSHQGKGWESLTDAVISWISKNASHNVVFLLWGKFAQKKSSLIDKRHKILTSAHPSPFSADSGFFGCKHFSQTNAYLRSQKLPEIKWSDL